MDPKLGVIQRYTNVRDSACCHATPTPCDVNEDAGLGCHTGFGAAMGHADLGFRPFNAER